MQVGGVFFSHKTVISWLMLHCSDYAPLLEQFRYTSCYDEMFFQTCLRPFIKDLHIETSTSMRYIDRHPKRPTNKLPFILDIVNSGMLFCRKVQSSELLDKLSVYAKD